MPEVRASAYRRCDEQSTSNLIEFSEIELLVWWRCKSLDRFGNKSRSGPVMGLCGLAAEFFDRPAIPQEPWHGGTSWTRKLVESRACARASASQIERPARWRSRSCSRLGIRRRASLPEIRITGRKSIANA